MNKKKLLSIFSWILIVSIFSAALFILYRELKEFRISDIKKSLAVFPSSKLIMGLFVTFLSYLTLTFYDFLAVHYAGAKLPYKKVAATSLLSYSFSNNIGLSAFSGSAVRFRYYSEMGLSAAQIIKIITFTVVTFWVGMAASGAFAFLLEPVPIPELFGFNIKSMTIPGIFLLAILLIYIILSIFLKKPLKIKDFEISLPGGKLLFLQLFIAAVDWLIAALVLYVLLPQNCGINYFTFFSIFMLAQTLGVVSNIPGGLGVFETTMLICLSSSISKPEIMTILMFYRLIYYIIPFVIGLFYLIILEMRLSSKRQLKTVQLIKVQLARIFPALFSFFILVAGIILIISGATPSIPERINWLNNIIPLHIIEISHLLGSISGVILIILSIGIYKRQDGAYYLSLIMLLAGGAFSLLKGFVFEETIVMTALFLCLLPCKSFFYRKSRLSDTFLSPQWFIMISVIVACSVWIGLFSFKHVDYSSDLWWRVELLNDTSRFFRASLGAVLFIFFFSIYSLIKSKRYKPSLGNIEDIDHIRSLISNANDTSSNLALLGDKLIFRNEDKTAFIMYNTNGQSWISMGDPIGNENEVTDLAWKFKEEAQRNGASPVFYEVDQTYLHIYIEMGMTVVKVGEEGLVELQTLTLAGKDFQDVRNVLNRLNKAGYTFEVVERENQYSIIEELHEISDSWLKSKKAGEKQFSLGFFNEEYLSNFRIGIVKKDSVILGFVNIWETETKKEVSIDLMRYRENSPPGIMDYLFTNMMLWGKAAGYEYFNIGVAPLSGLQTGEDVPVWNKVGSLIFTHGENFYNFQGLRKYKEKFKPIWKPKYLAFSGKYTMPRVLTDLMLLAGGGVRKTFFNKK